MSQEEFLQDQIEAIVDKVLSRANAGKLGMKWYLSTMYNYASVEGIHLSQTPSYYLNTIVKELKIIFPDATISKNLLETYILIDWSEN